MVFITTKGIQETLNALTKSSEAIESIANTFESLDPQKVNKKLKAIDQKIDELSEIR